MIGEKKKKIAQTRGAVVINSVGVIISRCVHNHFVRVQRKSKGRRRRSSERR